MENQMTDLRKIALAATLPASALLLCAALAAQAQPNQSLPINHAVNIEGVGLACSGVGLRAESNPRWKNYPVKLEVANNRGQYLADETVTLFDSDAGAPIHVRCNAPWLLMRLPAGQYQANVTLSNEGSQTISFEAPRAGQQDVIVRFPGRNAATAM